MSEREHVWPPDVTASSRCEVCGLQYAEWDTDETYFCHGSK